MGIKNLLKFLYNFPNIIKTKKISDLYGKKIAIDISILLYQSVISVRRKGYDLKNNNNMIISHIVGLLNKTLLLLKYGITPIYIFDGKPSSLKKNILKTRTSIKQKSYDQYINATNEIDRIRFFKRCVSITKEQMDDCRELLSLMGIPYINATEEADSELAYLCKNNLVYAVMTEDMDILTFGAPRIIRNMLSFKPLIEINLQDILENCKLTYEEFVELCIYFGCDYYSNNNNISNMDIYNKYINNKEQYNNRMQNNEYLHAKKYFIETKSNIENYNLELKEPKYDDLYNLLLTKYDIPITKIKYKLNKLYNTKKIDFVNI